MSDIVQNCRILSNSSPTPGELGVSVASPSAGTPNSSRTSALDADEAQVAEAPLPKNAVDRRAAGILASRDADDDNIEKERTSARVQASTHAEKHTHRQESVNSKQGPDAKSASSAEVCEDGHAEPEESSEDPETRFRLLYAQLVRENKHEDGGAESAGDLEKLSEILTDQGLNVEDLVNEIVAAVKAENAESSRDAVSVKTAAGAGNEAAVCPDEEGNPPGDATELDEDENGAQQGHIEEAAPPCDDTAAIMGEDAPQETSASETAQAPARSRTPQRGADGKTLKEGAPPRTRTPERGTDGKTLKAKSSSSRSRTPERNLAGGSSSSELVPAADRSSLKLVRSRSTSPLRAKVLQDYEGGEENTISIAVGDVVLVIDFADEEWWEGHIEGEGASNIGYFPATYVELIDDTAASAEPQAVSSKNSGKSKAKQKLKYEPPPPKLEPWEDPKSAEYDPQRVRANAAFRQQHTDGASTVKTKKAAMNKKQADAMALKAAEAEFSAEQSAQLEKLQAAEKRLFAEYQRAFDESSGMSKAQIQKAYKAHADAQAEIKEFRKAAVATVRQHSSTKATQPKQSTDESASKTRKHEGGAPARAPQQKDSSTKKVSVKSYLDDRGLSEWYRPLSLQGNIIKVSQLEAITERCDHSAPILTLAAPMIVLAKFLCPHVRLMRRKLMQVAKAAKKSLSEEEAKQLVERITS